MLDLSGSVTNSGTIVTGFSVASTSLTLTGGGLVQLNPNGISSAGIAATVAGYALDNVNNTISGSGTIGGGVAFDNQANGVVIATSGTLALNAAGQKFSNEGLMEAANGGILQVGAGTTLVDTGTIENAATLEALANGTLSVAAAGTITGLTATTISAGTLILSGAGSSVTFGGVALDATLASITAGAVLDIAAGRAFGGASALSDSGDIVLSGGTLAAASPSIAANGTLSGSGAVTATIANAGLIEARGGALSLNGVGGAGAVLVDAGATLTGDGTITNGVTDNGLISVAGGGLVLAGALTGNGQLAVNAGATLDLAGVAPITTISRGVTLSGAGSVLEAGATPRSLDSTLTSVGASATLAILNGRDFAAARALTVNGAVELGGGTLSAPSLTLGASGRLFGFGDVASTVSGGGVVAQGQGDTLTLAAGASGAALSAQAGATLELAASSSARAVSALGALRLDGVTLTPASVTVASGGRLVGSGTVTAGIGGFGTVEASGSLDITGAVANATLQIDAKATLELGAGASGAIDFTAISGFARLDTPDAVAATIRGFGGHDLIGFDGAVATGFSYDTTSHVLTVNDAGGTLATLRFAGLYTQASFELADNGRALAATGVAVATDDSGWALTADLAQAFAATFAPPPTPSDTGTTTVYGADTTPPSPPAMVAVAHGVG